MNSRVTKRERGLIKGALRRVFSRSELRRNAVEASVIKHHDPKRPRVTKWSRCPECKQPTPTYLMQVDHINPVVKISEKSEDLDANTLVDRLWSDEKNLVAICKPCHSSKTKLENKARRQYQKEKKKNA